MNLCRKRYGSAVLSPHPFVSRTLFFSSQPISQRTLPFSDASLSPPLANSRSSLFSSHSPAITMALSRGEVIGIFFVVLLIVFLFSFAICWNCCKIPNPAIHHDLETARHRNDTNNENNSEALPVVPRSPLDSRERRRRTRLERRLRQHGLSPTIPIVGDNVWMPPIIRTTPRHHRRRMFDTGPRERNPLFSDGGQGSQGPGPATASGPSQAERATAGRHPGCILLDNPDGEHYVLEDGTPILPPSYRPRDSSPPPYRFRDPYGPPSYQSVVERGHSPPSEAGPSTRSRPRPCPHPHAHVRSSRLQPTIVGAPAGQEEQMDDDSDEAGELVMRWSRRADWELALAQGRSPRPERD